MTLQTDMECFALDPDERQEVETVLAHWGRMGPVKLDQFLRPIINPAGESPTVHYHILRSRRFLVTPEGRVWRCRVPGMTKDGSGRPDTPVRRYSVEMWVGKWRPAIHHETGESTYAKNTVWASLEKGTSCPPKESPITHWQHSKGWKHPLDPPHKPGKAELQRLGEKAVLTKNVVYAMAQAFARNDGDTAKEAREAAKAVVEQDPILSQAKPKRRRKRVAPDPEGS